MRLLVLVALCGNAAAQAVPNEGRGPRHNSSFVQADDAPTLDAVRKARDAAEESRPRDAAQALHQLFASRRSAVVAVPGREQELYQSPSRWAATVLLGLRPPFGPKVLSAWRELFDGEGKSRIRRAMQANDVDALKRAIHRYPACTAAPGALMALSDRRLAAGDPEGALGLLDQVPHHLARGADDLLKSEAYTRRRAYLEAQTAPSAAWPTLGGAPHRARNGDPLPAGALKKVWEVPLRDPESTLYALQENERGLPQSPRIPFYPTTDGRRVFVHLGFEVLVADLKTGKLMDVVRAQRLSEQQRSEMAESIPWDTPGLRAATVDRGVLYAVLLKGTRATHRNKMTADQRNELWAYDLANRRRKWRQAPRLFFRGAPAVSGNRVFVYGARRAMDENGPTRKEEAFVHCYHRRSGRLLWERFLCFGDTDAAGNFPPLSGLSLAVHRGVVMAVTGLGVAASLDAETGEILWLLRYDRVQPLERERLSTSTQQRVPQRSQWFRTPPFITGRRVFLTPFDSESLYECRLRGRRRPRDGSFTVVLRALHRFQGHRNSVLEYVAGVLPVGPAPGQRRLYCVGRPDPDFPHAYETVVSARLDRPGEYAWLAYGRLPSRFDRDRGRKLPPDLFGRPHIAGSQLLVPTRARIHRFDLERISPVKGSGGEVLREIAELPPIGLAAHGPPAAGTEPPGPYATRERPLFGTVVSVGGTLLVATSQRLIAFRGVK